MDVGKKIMFILPRRVGARGNQSYRRVLKTIVENQYKLLVLSS